MILYLTGLNAVDPEQIEAGRLDGAKGFSDVVAHHPAATAPRDFYRLCCDDHWRTSLVRPDFDHDPGRTVRVSSRVLAYYMFEVALSEYGFRMGYGAAIAVILFLIMLCFIAYFLWSMYREEKGH